MIKMSLNCHSERSEESWEHAMYLFIHRIVFCLILIVGMAPSPTLASDSFPYKDVGDGEQATSVILTLVDGVVVDREGNIYLSHRSKNRIRKVTPDGIITTIAGNGIAGFSGDDGPAIEAALNFPAGLAVDDEHNLYIADRNNHRIRKVSPAGIITTVAGTGALGFSGDGGPAVVAQINFPSDVEVGLKGDLYFSDRSNHRIRKIDDEGIITTVAGIGVEGFGGDFGLAKNAVLKFPFGISMDRLGNLYIADRGNNRIRKVDVRGIITTIAGDSMHSFGGDYGPATYSNLAYPTDVVVDDEDNIYIADRNNNRIRKIDRQGVITTLMGIGKTDFNGDNEIAPETSLHLPFALAIHPGHKLVVVDRTHFRVRSVGLKNYTVTTVAGNGKSLFKGDGGPGQGATLNTPSGIVIDSHDNILFADLQHHRVRKLAPDGIITTYAGNGREGSEGNGGPALSAALFMPSTIAIDGEDNLYVVHRLGNGWVIRKIDAGGTITHFAGNGQQGSEGDGGPAVEASFYTISDIATDQAGNVYVSDATSRSIRKIDKNGRIHKVLDETMVPMGEEFHPNSVRVDGAGTIYFSDSGSSRIGKLDATGKFQIVGGTGEFKDDGDDGPAIDAGIRSPGGLLLNLDGTLFLAEEQTARIRKIDANGIISLVAGTGEPGFSGDNGLATQAKLKRPFRMVFDKDGNLIFTDRDNNRIRKIDMQGNISTLAGHGNFGWMQDGLEVKIAVHNFP
jgi:serine/threonine protein kinase, bacterial